MFHQSPKALAVALLLSLEVVGVCPRASRATDAGRDMFGMPQGLRGVEAAGLAAEALALNALPDDFQVPAPVGELNTAGNEADPFLYYDSLTIYFTSDRPGGFGGFDIWMATRPDRVSPFGAPVNLGAEVNTAANEIHPALSDGAGFLYFVRSDGLDTSNDIYCSQNLLGVWQRPKPVADINLADAESYPFPANDGRLYFSSKRQGGAGWDVWYAASTASDGISFGPAVRMPFLNTTGDELCFRMTRDLLSGYLARLPLPGFDSDLLYTTRSAPTDFFETTTAIPSVRSTSYESVPSVSDDRLELFFFSPNRSGGAGGADIWRSLSGTLPTPTPTPIPDIVLPEDATDWFGGVASGTGSVFQDSTAGLCMDAALTGDNVVGWVSPNEYLPLIDLAVLRLIFHVTTQQTAVDAIPLCDLTYDNFPANLYGGEGLFLDVTGGANGIGRPQGRNTFQLWASPNAVLTPQWRGTLGNGVPGENDETPFQAQYDTTNDMRLIARELDMGSAGVSADGDSGVICFNRIEVKAFPIPDFPSEGIVWEPPINNQTHGAETFDEMGAGIGVIDDATAEARFQLTEFGLGARKTLFPWDHAPDAVGPFHPIAWEADQLYRTKLRIRSDVGGSTGTVEGIDPVDVIVNICETATVEVTQLSLTTRGNPGNMHRAGSPRLLATTGGSPQPYVSFFYSHNPTLLDQSAFPGSRRFRFMGDIVNVAEIGPDGVGADPLAITEMFVERIGLP